MDRPVRVRFAPSPTGFLHVGGVRTAIFNVLFARRQGGKFILRIEDTDHERNTEAALQQILESLRWLGLAWDEGPLRQSDRQAIYRAHLDRLLASGQAYRCYCSADALEAKRQKAIAEKRTYKYDRACRDLPAGGAQDGRPCVVRFRMPDQLPDHFDDLIKGRIPIEAENLDDWILARTDGSPTYNFCVVVDDADMGISHVIRGDDHVINTPRQIMLYRAFGFPEPRFAHMPLVHGPDGSKLSKRREAEYRAQGISVSALEYRAMGYLPQAVVNYFARLGWSHGDQEIFSRAELEELFELKDVGKSASVMNPEKFKWLNAHYLKATPDEELARMLPPYLTALGFQAEPGPRLGRIAGAFKERAKTLAEIAEQARMFFEPPKAYDPKAVQKNWKPDSPGLLAQVRALVAARGVEDEPGLEEAFRQLAEAHAGGKLGAVAQPVRIALTGSSASPSLFLVMAILGRDEVVRRLDQALASLPPSQPG
jgi:glutamyl-tRNA synthetase